MSRIKSERYSAISQWTRATATVLVGVFVVLGLGTVIPVFMESTLTGMSARSVVAALCLAVFITDHRRRGRQVGREESRHHDATDDVEFHSRGERVAQTVVKAWGQVSEEHYRARCIAHEIPSLTAITSTSPRRLMGSLGPCCEIHLRDQRPRVAVGCPAGTGETRSARRTVRSSGPGPSRRTTDSSRPA